MTDIPPLASEEETPRDLTPKELEHTKIRRAGLLGVHSTVCTPKTTPLSSLLQEAQRQLGGVWELEDPSRVVDSENPHQCPDDINNYHYIFRMNPAATQAQAAAHIPEREIRIVALPNDYSGELFVDNQFITRSYGRTIAEAVGILVLDSDPSVVGIDIIRLFTDEEKEKMEALATGCGPDCSCASPTEETEEDEA